jgi:hypothetical protein
MDAISNCRELIFNKFGVYFVIILWPPAAQYFDDITDDIANTCTIVEIEDYQCNDEVLAEFCLDIYDVDGGTAYKILRKNHNMKQGQNTLRILHVYEPEQRWKRNEKGALVCENMEILKRGIREKYKNCIPNYIHDIVIHISDAPDSSRTTNDVISSYLHSGKFDKLLINSYKNTSVWHLDFIRKKIVNIFK